MASLFRNTSHFSMTSYNLFLPARRMPQTRRRQGGVGQLFRELEKVHTASQLDGNPQSQQPELRTDTHNHVALQYMDEPNKGPNFVGRALVPKVDKMSKCPLESSSSY